MNVLRVVGEVVFSGLLRGWPGMPCPGCRKRRGHRQGCKAWHG